MSEQVKDYPSYLDRPKPRKKQTMADWISVKERLPQDKHSVMVYCPYSKCIYTAYYDDFNEEWYYFGCGGGIEVYYTVTHWMLLPEPPKEGGGEDGQR